MGQKPVLEYRAADIRPRSSARQRIERAAIWLSIALVVFGLISLIPLMYITFTGK